MSGMNMRKSVAGYQNTFIITRTGRFVQRASEATLKILLFKLAPVKQDGPFLIHRFSLFAQMPLHSATEPLFHDVMHAGRGLRDQAAQLLETPSGSRLKPLKASPNRMFDSRVIADVEVEISFVLEGSPVAPE